MSARPVRLVIASPDVVVTVGLRQILAGQAHRVEVVEDASGPVDVVLHDADGPGGESREAVLRRTGATGWVPLRVGVEQIVQMVEAAATPSVPVEIGHGLSAREVQVLALIAAGLTNQEIADRVFVSINSVKTYVRSAYRKIGVNSRSQAAVWGLQHGLVDRD